MFEQSTLKTIVCCMLGTPQVGIVFLLVLTNGIDESVESEIADFEEAHEIDRAKVKGRSRAGVRTNQYSLLGNHSCLHKAIDLC
jgi:hypothetical protein